MQAKLDSSSNDHSAFDQQIVTLEKKYEDKLKTMENQATKAESSLADLQRQLRSEKVRRYFSETSPHRKEKSSEMKMKLDAALHQSSLVGQTKDNQAAELQKLKTAHQVRYVIRIHRRLLFQQELSSLQKSLDEERASRNSAEDQKRKLEMEIAEMRETVAAAQQQVSVIFRLCVLFSSHFCLEFGFRCRATTQSNNRQAKGEDFHRSGRMASANRRRGREITLSRGATCSGTNLSNVLCFS